MKLRRGTGAGVGSGVGSIGGASASMLASPGTEDEAGREGEKKDAGTGDGCGIMRSMARTARAAGMMRESKDESDVSSVYGTGRNVQGYGKR
jgi:hypothetical protein